MVAWSLFGHVVLVALALLLGTRVTPPTREPIMTISLGGAPGPRTGGMTQIGAQAIQAAPIEPPTRPTPVAPPAPTPPRMAIPDPRSKPRPQQPRPERAPPESTARRPNTGPEPVDGSARVDTGAKRGQGFGLSSAGGAGGAVQLDVANFCCPDYIAQMVDVIHRSWDDSQGVVGSTGTRFTIARDGTILAPQVEEPSGFIALDNAAMRALQVTKLPPLPAAFPNATLTIHLRFDYQR
jgi:TonB family protein